MLRLAVARSNLCLEQSARLGLRSQWRIAQPLALNRSFADSKLPDQVVLPGTQSGTVAGVPQPPILKTAAPTGTDVPASLTPKVPPTPAEVKATPPAPSTNTGNLPPTGHGTAATGPSSAPPPPPKRRRRLRTLLLSLIVLGSLGYAGGVYFSLVNDNFHDFFTEYVPFGEDSVAYFEEREFRKRFPTRELIGNGKNWPQTRGENKITIGRSSGVNPRIAPENAGSDLGQKGRHVSAIEDNSAKASTPSAGPPAPKKDAPAPPKEKADVKAKTEQPKVASNTPEKPAAAPAASAPPAKLIDHITVAEATEPVVQDLVKILNNIITAVNASPEAGKYSSTLQTAKGDLNNAIAAIKSLKDSTAQEAESKIKDAHAEFDSAAKELVRRLESEMHDQELRWREEYESEREKLSTSYAQKLTAELDAARKVSAEESKNALLEQEISLQKTFLNSISSKIEEERSGRLSKLDSLSASVDDLSSLTGQWSSVVDATLSTQHLQIALASVQAKLASAAASDRAEPFVDELVALKSVAARNPVVDAAIAAIPPVAYQRGIPSPAALIDRFRRVAAEVRKAALLPEDAGVASHAASAVLSKFLFAKKSERGLPEGDDVEATLARTEVLLEEGDLDAAAREMNGLRGWAGVLSRDWVGEVRRVLEVRQAVDVIATEARLQSLLVD